MFKNIQMLRAVAAILVMMHHARTYYDALGGSSSLIGFVGRWGFTGVDIFFAISGFVIAHTTLTKERTGANAGEFLKHRFLRIYLGYWPFFLLYLALYAVVAPERIATFDLFDSFFLTGTDMFKLVVPVSWSLSYELYFYGLFLLSFLLPAALARKAIWLIFIALLVKASFAPRAGGDVAYFLASTFLLEFFGGAIVWMVVQRFDNPWLIPLVVAGAVIGYWVGIARVAEHGPIRVFSFGSGAVCILFAAVLLEKSGIYKAGRISIELGNASYTIYLSHVALLGVVSGTVIRTFLSTHGEIVRELGFLSALAAILLLSVIGYRWLERPLYRFACSLRLPGGRGAAAGQSVSG